MDVAAQHVLGVWQDGSGVIGEDDLHLRAAFPDELGVIFHIVHTGEGVLLIAEQLAVALQGKHVPIGVYALFVQEVQADQVVAHLVGGIAEHQDDFLGPLGDAPQADGKAVAAENGEDDAHGLAAQLGLHIVGDIVHRGIVALGAGHDSLSHGNHVTVPDGEAVVSGRLQHGIGDDLHQVITAADDRGPQAAGNGTDHTTHVGTLLIVSCVSFHQMGNICPQFFSIARNVQKVNKK